MGKHVYATLDTSSPIATQGGKESLARHPQPCLASSIHCTPINSRFRATDDTKKDLCGLRESRTADWSPVPTLFPLQKTSGILLEGEWLRAFLDSSKKVSGLRAKDT